MLIIIIMVVVANDIRGSEALLLSWLSQILRSHDFKLILAHRREALSVMGASSPRGSPHSHVERSARSDAIDICSKFVSCGNARIVPIWSAEWKINCAQGAPTRV